MTSNLSKKVVKNFLNSTFANWLTLESHFNAITYFHSKRAYNNFPYCLAKYAIQEKEKRNKIYYLFSGYKLYIKPE